MLRPSPDRAFVRSAQVSRRVVQARPAWPIRKNWQQIRGRRRDLGYSGEGRGAAEVRQAGLGHHGAATSSARQCPALVGLCPKRGETIEIWLKLLSHLARSSDGLVDLLPVTFRHLCECEKRPGMTACRPTAAISAYICKHLSIASPPPNKIGTDTRTGAGGGSVASERATTRGMHPTRRATPKRPATCPLLRRGDLRDDAAQRKWAADDPPSPGRVSAKSIRRVPWHGQSGIEELQCGTSDVIVQLGPIHAGRPGRPRDSCPARSGRTHCRRSRG